MTSTSRFPRGLTIAGLVLAAVAIGVALTTFKTDAVASSVISFQNGINGYNSAENITITTQYADAWNNYNGNTYKTGMMLCYQAPGAAAYEARALVRFSNLSLPKSATVTNATLTLTFSNWESDFTINGYYLTAAWNPASADIGWQFRDTPKVAWSSPGANGNSDVLPNKNFTLSGFNASGYQTKTVPLDASVVQNWITNPAVNQGLLLVNTTPGPMPRLMGVDDSDLNKRPLLTITYNLASSPLIPTSAPPTQTPTSAAPNYTLTSATTTVSPIIIATTPLSFQTSTTPKVKPAAPTNLVTKSGASVKIIPRPQKNKNKITVKKTITTTHPRLFFTQTDLPRLRSWAVDTNPIYVKGIKYIAEKGKTAMDKGLLNTDDGGNNYTSYPNEMYAELFAFMSMVAPDQATRDDYGQRARARLMYAINKAAPGSAKGQPFRDPYFSTGNRSRWWGEGFPLAVDWAYPYLSAADKATIRQVFLRWSEENLHADITTDNHPEPIGKLNDPVLNADKKHVRWAGNNYFTAHMRNLGLMSLALDPADDPGNTLGNYLKNATGAWLYMSDYLMNTDIKGGLPAEGFEYSPQAVGYVAQFLLALHTAGQDDPKLYGSQVVLGNNAYWNNAVTQFFQSNSPAPQTPLDPNYSWMGAMYQPAWYGDGAHYWTPDFIGLFGPLALYDKTTGNTARYSALRWAEINTPPGGAVNLNYRVNSDVFLAPILYFLMLDPSAGAPADPRPNYPLSVFAPGLGRILARTDWTNNAAWFTYKLGWNKVDHQHADGNMFEFYRNGEWLTKEQSGYGFTVANTDVKNSVAIHNNTPNHTSPNDYRGINWTHGSQWLYVADGDGKILAKSLAADYTYALGDATDLYNSTYENSTDVKHASRSIVWLKPDYIVVYDRAETKSPNQFKRFWLSLPFNATVNGLETTMTTAKGQKLYIKTLLPANATLSVEAATLPPGEHAALDPIQYRLKVEAAGAPLNTRFLHVLQGANASVPASPASLVQSSAGTAFAGVVVNTTAVLFPVTLSDTFTSVTYSIPATVTKQLVTGLTPNGLYSVTKQTVNGLLQVTVTAGGTLKADEGGVLGV